MRYALHSPLPPCLLPGKEDEGRFRLPDALAFWVSMMGGVCVCISAPFFAVFFSPSPLLLAICWKGGKGEKRVAKDLPNHREPKELVGKRLY